MKAADRLAGFLGSWIFLGAVLAWAALGCAFAFLGLEIPIVTGRDPFLLWLGSLAAIVAVQQTVLLMVRSQQSLRDRLKSDLDYEFEMKTEFELAHLHRRFDALEERQRSQQAGVELDRAIATPVRSSP